MLRGNNERIRAKRCSLGGEGCKIGSADKPRTVRLPPSRRRSLQALKESGTCTQPRSTRYYHEEAGPDGGPVHAR